MEVKRICQWCSKPFIAQKTTTNYCSPQCSKRGYKHRMKEWKMELRQIQEMVEVKKKLESQEYFTFSQTAKLMGVSRQYIYKLVKEDKLRASRLSSRMSLIRRADIELMLKTKPYESIKPKDDVDITEYYTAEQIAEKYKVNTKWVWTYTREHDNREEVRNDPCSHPLACLSQQHHFKERAWADLLLETAFRPLEKLCGREQGRILHRQGGNGKIQTFP